jgi:hypothetical protein
MATLSASRRNSSGAPASSPRPSISGSLYTNVVNCQNGKRMTSVNEEEDETASNKIMEHLGLNKKDPRSCNERSDSGFSECSSCSSVSVPCACSVSLFTKISEESANGEIEECDSSLANDLHQRLEEIHVDSSDTKSEVSSLEMDDLQKTSDSSIVESLIVPSLGKPFPIPSPDLKPMSEIEKRKVSLESLKHKKSETKKPEFSLEKLKNTSKVAQLMEKFNSPEKEEPMKEFPLPANKKSFNKIKANTSDVCGNNICKLF